MALSEAELVIFKADILTNSNQVVIDARNAGNNNDIANWYSELTSGFWGFRNQISPEEVGSVIELDDVANMTTGDVGKLNSFFGLRPGGFNGSKLSDRAGFDDVLSAAAANESQEAVAALWQQLATNLEELFATGGVGTNGDPATMVVEGGASLDDVRNALALP